MKLSLSIIIALACIAVYFGFLHHPAPETKGALRAAGEGRAAEVADAWAMFEGSENIK